MQKKSIVPKCTGNCKNCANCNASIRKKDVRSKGDSKCADPRRGHNRNNA